MLFRQLFDKNSSTYTYLLADPDSGEAVLIDTVLEQSDRDAAVVQELGLRLVATIETHVHADHVTGAWALRQQLGSAIIYPLKGGVQGADRLVDHGDTIEFGRYSLEVRSTPGHTAGCTSYVTADHRMAFTGDALMIRGAGRTDFQQGDARTLYRSVWAQILSLSDDALLYPGHDYKGRTVTTVAEEREHNPRLGKGNTEDEFVHIMDNLNLSYPKHIDRALPANKALGRLVEEEESAPSPFDGAERSAAGAARVTTRWVEVNSGDVRLIDVRGPDEYSGPLGHIDGSELVPLPVLVSQAMGWEKRRPIVTVCKSGGRSDTAAVTLERMGFCCVASMRGGMTAWRSDAAAKSR